MKKLSLMALVVVLSACKGDTIDGEAIHARVLLPPQVSATCVLFEVRDPSSKAVLDKRWLSRDDGDLQVAVFRGSLPETVELAARPFLDGTCQGGAEAKTPNGVFKTVPAIFVKGMVPSPTEIRLEPGADGDTDGYVSTAEGGADCRDEDLSVNPGVQEACALQVDSNCDGKKGCEASTCGLSACVGPAATLVMGVPGSPVTAGSCASGSLRVTDANGANTRVGSPTSVSLEAPSGGVLFFSDSACTVPASSVTLTGNEDSVSFFFQGQIAGTVALRASAPGLTTATQSLQVLPGAGNRLVFLSPARSAVARACSEVVQFQSQDALGNPAQVSTATTVTLEASPPTGFKFYSDASCTTEVTSGVTLAAGTSTGSFFFRGTQAGDVNMTIAATGFTGSQQTATITAGPPSVMVFTGPATATAGECSGLVTVTLRDADGNVATATSATNISLTPNGGDLKFSPSTGCGSNVSSVSIAEGSSSTTFRYHSAVAGTFSIGGSFGSLTSTPLSVTVNPGPPTVLALTPTTSQTLSAGSCSAMVTAQLRDALGNAVNVTSDTPVTLTSNSPADFEFFTNAGCTGSAVTSTTIPAGSSTASFYFKGTRAATVAMTAAQGAFTASQNATITPGTASVLRFAQPSATVMAGACTQATVQVQDSFGNTATVSGNQTVTLSANPSAGVTFSTANNCVSTTSQVTLNSGQSSVVLHVKATVAGSVGVTAAVTNFTPGTLALTVNPASPNKLVFVTAPQSLEVGACSGITTVEVQDAFNNPTTLTNGANVTLSGNPSGSITFYSGAGCTDVVSSVPILAGQGRASFYFRDSTVENVTITAASTGLNSGTQQQIINPRPPTALAFTTPGQTVLAGACSNRVTVQAQAQGTATPVSSPIQVTLSASPGTGFTFYSNNSCSDGNEVTQVTIATGQSNADFYFRGTVAGTPLITASSTGLTEATQNATITAQPPTRVAFITPAHTVVSDTCSPLVTLQTRDTHGNVSAVGANTDFTLADSGTPADNQFGFYSNANCTDAIGNVTVASGQTTASFYFKGRRARTVTLTAAAAGFADGTQNHTVTAGAASAVGFSLDTPAQTLLAGTCALRTLEFQDAAGNPVAGTSSVDVTLSASTLTEFFQDSSCTTPTTQVTLAAGSTSANFYFKGYQGGINTTAPLTLTATPTEFPAVNQVETLIPTVRTGACQIGNDVTSTASAACAITPALTDMSKAFLVFQATSLNNSSTRANVRCFLHSLSEVKCDRAGIGSPNAVSIRWSVAEFPSTSPVSVRHSDAPCINDLTSVSVTPSVTNLQSFLLLSSKRESGDQGNTVPRRAELTSGAAAEIRKMGGCGTIDANHLQVVSYPNAFVQRGVSSLTSGEGTSTQVDIPTPVALGRSILLYSWISDGSGAKICDRILRGALTPEGDKVTFSRGEGDSANCAGSGVSAISWEVVQFPEGTVVQQVTKQLTGLTGTAMLGTSVDLSRTLVLGGGQWASGQVHGEGRHSASELITEMRAQSYLANSSTVNFARETANNSATFTVYVVQLKP